MFEIAVKALLVATFVWAALEASRRGGVRLAGLSASSVTAPSLALLAWHHDAAFVAEASLGVLMSTPACAGFAAAYAIQMRRSGSIGRPLAAAAVAMLAAAFLAGAGWLLLNAVEARLEAALMIGCGACLCALPLVRRGSGGAILPSRRAAACWVAPLLAGSVSAAVCTASTGLGATLSGLVAGLPVVALCLAAGTHQRQGVAAVARSMHAYVQGLLLRMMFVSIVAVLAQALGSAMSLLLAAALTLIVGVLMHQLTEPLRGDALSANKP
jgi:hypothetical protein